MEKVHLILADLSDVEYQVECMVQVLEALDEIYDHKEEKVARGLIQVFQGWTKNLGEEVAAVCDELEAYERIK